ncbi:MAG: PAS domain S-box protein [Pseudomonadota bacterium]
MAFPPLVPQSYFLDEQGWPQGFAFELMEQICHRAGLKTRYLIVDSLADAIEAVRTGRAQVIPILSATESRKRVLDFSCPIEQADVVLFVLKSAFPADPPDARALRIGTVADTTAEEMALSRGVEPFTRFTSYGEALMQLLAGKVDAVVGQKGALTALARRAKVDHLIRPAAPPILSTYRALAVGKGNAELLRLIEPELKLFMTTPEYHRLFDKWFGAPEPFWRNVFWLWALSGLLVLGLAVMTAWRLVSLRRVNRLLRQAVAAKEAAQVAAKAKAQELQLILDTVPAAIWFKNAENRFLRVNREAARLLGRAPAEIEGRHARDIFPAWLAEKYHWDDLEVVARQRPLVGIEEQYLRADGSAGWVSTHKVPWQDPASERFGVLALCVDITRRKEVEQQLGESEDRFRQMAEMLPTAICEVDLDHRITYLNGAGVQLLRLSPTELDRGLSMYDLLQGGDLATALSRGRDLLAGDKVPPHEYRLHDSAGRMRSILISSRLVRRNGHPAGFIFTMTDLTQRRESEDALRQAKEQLENRVAERTADLAAANQRMQEEVVRRINSEGELERALSMIAAAFQSVADGIAVVGSRGRLAFFNDSFRRMWSLPESILDQSDIEAALEILLPQLQEPDQLGAQIDRALLNPADGLSFTLALNDGRVVEVRSLPQRLRGKIIGRVWCFRDVTERLGMERALRQSEEKHRQVVDNAQEAIVVVQEGRVVFFNPKALTLTGLSHPEMHGHAIAPLIHPGDRELVCNGKQNQAGVFGAGVLQEFRLLHRDGSCKWVESNFVSIQWEGRPATLHLLNDATKRKEAAAALQDSLRTLEATLVASPVGICFVRERVLLWANAAMYALTGYPAEELIGRPTSLLYADPAEYERLGAQLYDRAGGSDTWSTDSQFRRRDGSSVDVFLQARRLDPTQPQRGVIVAVTDISERKRAEADLLAYQEQLRRLIHEINVIEERERRRIASDLHDGLGQELALMRIKLAALVGAPGKPNKKGIREIITMMDKALLGARALSWDLSAPMLRELGLGPALEWLAEQTHEKHGVKTVFHSEGEGKDISQTLANSLFRMARELVMNAVKHAHCELIRVGLVWAARQVVLTVEDDGIGFDVSRLERQLDKGFGLFNIRGVVDSWGGVTLIQSLPGYGSRVRLEAPLRPFVQ